MRKLKMAMIRRNLVAAVLFLGCLLPLAAQEKPLNREVTLYNPYKPSLTEAKKKSYLPEMNDTARFRPEFSYNVTATPFMPEHTISPIKAAALQPDPLSKLYRSYVKVGLGNYFSPLGELSITNERSKNGAAGFYARHYSTNGKIKLDHGQKVFAGSMDNEMSLFGKRFFRGGVVGGAVNYDQFTRHAYGYDPDPDLLPLYNPSRKETRLSYSDVGAVLSLASTTLDSSVFLYDFRLGYDYFFQTRDLYQHNIALNGVMSRTFRGFYAGAGLDLNYFNTPDSLLVYPKYVVAASPFIKKATSQWNFKLGLKAVLERNLEETAKAHLYPDLAFGFSIVPSYLYFFTTLDGRLEVNDPMSVARLNPYLIPDGTLFKVPNTNHQIVATAGLKGNSGIEGNYELSVKYSLVNDMLFFANRLVANNLPGADTIYGNGNYFKFLTDDADVLQLHGALSGKFTDKLSFNSGLNWYRYTLTRLHRPFYRPGWDASVGLSYNLRDKILAGVQLTALGPRSIGISHEINNVTVLEYEFTPEPWHLNVNLSAEYRYSKILSFWAKFNSLATDRYYEWAFYPTHRFMFMAGFTYSL
ncbi:MAG TPA: hypothetical protein VK155_19145 [Bacteroidales bacterium]|nr:hypothetical protein [Bacteroidales bacterium]